MENPSPPRDKKHTFSVTDKLQTNVITIKQLKIINITKAP